VAMADSLSLLEKQPLLKPQKIVSMCVCVCVWSWQWASGGT